MRYKCIESAGLEDVLSEGQVYVGRSIGSGMLEIKAGKTLDCFHSRFVPCGIEPGSDIRCVCSTSSNPPCSYCEGGGWCSEHGEMRHDCGCEWDEIEEY